MQRCGERRAAALEDAQRQGAVCRLEGDAQCSRRGFVRRGKRPEQGHEGAAGLRRHREPPQVRIAGIAQPCDERMAACRAQRLLGRPKRLAPPGRPHHRQMREVEARSGERRRVRQMRRRDPDDALAGGGKSGKRGHQQGELTDPLKAAKQLGQPFARPAAARQLAVKLAVPARQSGGKPRECAAAPDRVPLEDFFERRHDTVFSYSTVMVSRPISAAGRRRRSMTLCRPRWRARHSGCHRAPRA